MIALATHDDFGFAVEVFVVCIGVGVVIADVLYCARKGGLQVAMQRGKASHARTDAAAVWVFDELCEPVELRVEVADFVDVLESLAEAVFDRDVVGDLVPVFDCDGDPVEVRVTVVAADADRVAVIAADDERVADVEAVVERVADGELVAERVAVTAAVCECEAGTVADAVRLSVAGEAVAGGEAVVDAVDPAVCDGVSDAEGDADTDDDGDDVAVLVSAAEVDGVGVFDFDRDTVAVLLAAAV